MADIKARLTLGVIKFKYIFWDLFIKLRYDKDAGSSKIMQKLKAWFFLKFPIVVSNCCLCFQSIKGHAMESPGCVNSKNTMVDSKWGRDVQLVEDMPSWSVPAGLRCTNWQGSTSTKLAYAPHVILKINSSLQLLVGICPRLNLWLIIKYHSINLIVACIIIDGRRHHVIRFNN